MTLNDPGAKTGPVAIALIVASTVYILLILIGMVVFARRLNSPDQDFAIALMIILNCAVPLIFNLMLILGATCIYRRTSYMWAYATCCLAMFPMCGSLYLLGIPLGIWGLVVLRKPEVRDSFRYM